MMPQELIDRRNAEIAYLKEKHAALTKNSSVGQLRWGRSGPFTDLTRWCLADTERQMADLKTLNQVIRSGGLLSFRQAQFYKGN
jgi:hypothetical protein